MCFCHRKEQEIFTAEHIILIGVNYPREIIQQFALVSSTGSINVCSKHFCDLGFSRTYAASTMNGTSLSTPTFYIGSALTTPHGVVGNSYLCSALPNNPPFSLSNRSTYNSVNVRILDSDANQTNFTPELSYTLVISCLLYTSPSPRDS